ncbi:MAG: glycosyltransferase family 9 protein [Planctomycetes bacterium]|nr:glycosyltransferase family 9 protein [Planctomycetota bacterium]
MSALTDRPRILIVRLSALGDVVHVLPALAALRAALPRALIGWAVEDRAASLLEGHPHLDRLHVVPRAAWSKALRKDPAWVLRGLRRTLRDLRAARYEVSLDFQSNLRSSALAWASGAPRRVGQPRPFAKEGSRALSTCAPAPVARDVHKIERNLALLGPLGLPPGPPPRPVVPEPPAATALGEAFVAAGGPRVIIHPGVSAFGALKAWREDRFADLARRLVADGARVLFAYGGAAEEAVARALAAQAPGAELTPRTSGILELAALLRRADLVVGVDSGPLHLAAAVGAPVLGLYGPKHPGTYGPYWTPSEVARAGLDCSPCRHRRCPRDDVVTVEGAAGPMRISPCMDRLEVDLAHAAARRLLG